MDRDTSKIARDEVEGISGDKNIVKPKKKPVYAIVKRLFDIIVSFTALTVLLVPSLIIALIIVIDSPGASPIFVQKRAGKNGKMFSFYKFRSMVPNADKMLDQLLDKNEMDGPVFKIKEDPRITKVGKFMRKTSLDEIPQLINILTGKMSFVGPRPPLPREVEKYTEEQWARLSVIPGLTCYWQVQPTRNNCTFNEWMELDLKYIEERGILTDIKILFKTVGVVFGMDGE